MTNDLQDPRTSKMIKDTPYTYYSSTFSIPNFSGIRKMKVINIFKNNKLDKASVAKTYIPGYQIYESWRQ